MLEGFRLDVQGTTRAPKPLALHLLAVLRPRALPKTVYEESFLRSRGSSTLVSSPEPVFLAVQDDLDERRFEVRVKQGSKKGNRPSYAHVVHQKAATIAYTVDYIWGSIYFTSTTSTDLPERAFSDSIQQLHGDVVSSATDGPTQPHGREDYANVWSQHTAASSGPRQDLSSLPLVTFSFYHQLPLPGLARTSTAERILHTDGTGKLSQTLGQRFLPRRSSKCRSVILVAEEDYDHLPGQIKTEDFPDTDLSLEEHRYANGYDRVRLDYLSIDTQLYDMFQNPLFFAAKGNGLCGSLLAQDVGVGKAIIYDAIIA
ncbi:hypothetical protein C8034_v009213 [Colletotrichum sidae]|uniref:Uncharacterized protein n=1 Tax=Colletotrichum sidae TaxID=1347389 RepID=A0A4R8TPI9_9PEZI|nr:hypothetical protein C8034_v009213 [Colletotrichum sidae]